MCTGLGMGILYPVWRSEDIQQGSALFYYPVGCGDPTWVVGIGSKCLHLLNHLDAPPCSLVFVASIVTDGTLDTCGFMLPLS